MENESHAFSFQDTDIYDIDPSVLVDRKDIHIDPSLPREERALEFIRQSNGHPDCLIFEGVVVLYRFKENGPTIEDCLEAVIRNA